MKLLLIQGGFGAGGAEKVMAQIAAHRHARGDKVGVVAMDMPPEGPFFTYPPGVGLTVLAQDAPRDTWLHLRRMAAIRRHIRVTQPDLILSFLTKINCLTLLAARGSGVPVVISERNNPRAQSPRWAGLQNLLARRAAAIVMQTDAARDDLPARLRSRARVIPNPCAPVDFVRPPGGPGCHFVAVGRLDRQKGFDRLIRAFDDLPADPAIRLTIFGEGPERAALQAQVRSAGLAGRVAMPGLAADAAQWLGAGDALVVTSHFEGFPNIIAEAACSGLPVIAFDCPYGPSEMVRDHENGLLLVNGDIAGLTRAMARLAADPDLRKRLGQSRGTMAQKLDPRHVLALWDQVLSEASRPSN